MVSAPHITPTIVGCLLMEHLGGGVEVWRVCSTEKIKVTYTREPSQVATLLLHVLTVLVAAISYDQYLHLLIALVLCRLGRCRFAL